MWFAQEARAYALMVLLCTAGLCLFLVWLQDRRPGALAGWAVVSALALATHYYAALMVAAELGWMLFAARDARGRVLLAAAPVAATGVALVPLAVAQRSNRLAVPLAEESSTVLRTLQVPKQFAVGFDAPLEVPLAVVCLVFAVAGAALLRSRTDAERDRLAPAVVVGGAVVLIPIALAVAGFDFVSARYEVAGLVPLALCVAAGCATPRTRRLGAAIAVALCAIWLAVVVAVANDPLLQTRAAWRAAAHALGPVPPGGRAIVLTPSAGRKPFEVYLPKARLLKSPTIVVSEVALLSVRSSGEAEYGLRALPAARRRPSRRASSRPSGGARAPTSSSATAPRGRSRCRWSGWPWPGWTTRRSSPCCSAEGYGVVVAGGTAPGAVAVAAGWVARKAKSTRRRVRGDRGSR